MRSIKNGPIEGSFPEEGLQMSGGEEVVHRHQAASPLRAHGMSVVLQNILPAQFRLETGKFLRRPTAFAQPLPDRGSGRAERVPVL